MQPYKVQNLCFAFLCSTLGQESPSGWESHRDLVRHGKVCWNCHKQKASKPWDILVWYHWGSNQRPSHSGKAAFFSWQFHKVYHPSWQSIKRMNPCFLSLPMAWLSCLRSVWIWRNNNNNNDDNYDTHFHNVFHSQICFSPVLQSLLRRFIKRELLTDAAPQRQAVQGASEIGSWHWHWCRDCCKDILEIIMSDMSIVMCTKLLFDG